MTHQQVVLVTGASSGIGQATGSFVKPRGFLCFLAPAVILKWCKVKLLRCCLWMCGPMNLLEIASPCSWNELAVWISWSTMPDISGRWAAIEEINLADAKRVFETNFFGMVRMVNTVLPTMRAQNCGQIINIGSIAGIASPPFYAYYTATKRAIEGYTESLRYEVKHFNVRVSCVEPGYYSTNLYNTKVPAARIIDDYVQQRKPRRRCHGFVYRNKVGMP